MTNEAALIMTVWNMELEGLARSESGPPDAECHSTHAALAGYINDTIPIACAGSTSCDAAV